MQGMAKMIPELFAMLKSAKVEIKKKHQVLMVNKTTSFKKKGKGKKGSFKKNGKQVATLAKKPKVGPVGVLGTGGPQTCLPAAHGMAELAGLYGPSSSTRHSRPSRGAKPHEADNARPPQERPHQAGS